MCRKGKKKKKRKERVKINKNNVSLPHSQIKTSVWLKRSVIISKEKVVLMCHNNKLSISTKIHFRAHNTASSITNKQRDHSS